MIETVRNAINKSVISCSSLCNSILFVCACGNENQHLISRYVNVRFAATEGFKTSKPLSPIALPARERRINWESGRSNALCSIAAPAYPTKEKLKSRSVREPTQRSRVVSSNYSVFIIINIPIM